MKREAKPTQIRILRYPSAPARSAAMALFAPTP